MSTQPKTLYEVNGNIVDINTLLIPRAEVEADKQLMALALDALKSNATWPFPKKREEAIALLGQRLGEVG